MINERKRQMRERQRVRERDTVGVQRHRTPRGKHVLTPDVHSALHEPLDYGAAPSRMECLLFVTREHRRTHEARQGVDISPTFSYWLALWHQSKTGMNEYLGM